MTSISFNDHKGKKPLKTPQALKCSELAWGKSSTVVLCADKCADQRNHWSVHKNEMRFVVMSISHQPNLSERQEHLFCPVCMLCRRLVSRAGLGQHRAHPVSCLSLENSIWTCSEAFSEQVHVHPNFPSSGWLLVECCKDYQLMNCFRGNEERNVLIGKKNYCCLIQYSRIKVLNDTDLPFVLLFHTTVPKVNLTDNFAG